MPPKYSSTTHPTPLLSGVYAPLITPFHPDNEDLDLPALKTHAVRLATAGLVGLVALGSNGEAVHLSDAERGQVINTVRGALDEGGFGHVPVIAGCSAQSVRGTLRLCEEAALAGAGFAMVLPPCYYKGAMTDDALVRFFESVADQSPIPVCLYNYPGAAAGVDLTSEVMIEVAKHPNVVGAKFTCASTGKIVRVAEGTNAVSIRGGGSGFLAAGGMADITVQTAVSGGSGVIAGTANILPKYCVRVWDLCRRGEWDEAMRMQKGLARADAYLNKGGVPVTKAALNEIVGYGGFARRPLPKIEGDQATEVMFDLHEALEVEDSL